MIKTTISIDGMSCGMCESHVADTIRRNFDVKKVKASHRSGTCEVVSEAEIDPAALRKALDPTGYRVVSLSSEPYQRRGLFGR